MNHSGEEELFDLVDEHDSVIGGTRRADVHGNPTLIHRVAHVIVLNDGGEIFLQKRSGSKDVQPGKWDTSVGGHVDRGETYYAAARREMAEELGITDAELRFSHKYLHRNSYESEYVVTYLAEWTGETRLDRAEIDEGRFWTAAEIESQRSSGLFTPNFLDEFDRWRALST